MVIFANHEQTDIRFTNNVEAIALLCNNKGTDVKEIINIKKFIILNFYFLAFFGLFVASSSQKNFSNKIFLALAIVIAGIKNKFLAIALCNAGIKNKFLALALCNAGIKNKFLALAIVIAGIKNKFLAIALCNAGIKNKFLALALRNASLYMSVLAFFLQITIINSNN